jgi:hypothetical protein
MELKINLSNSEHKDLISFCNLNDLLVSETIKKSYLTGFNIERFGLLSAGQNTIEVEVEKEVIKYVEIPIETIKEVIKIEYVDVPVEKIVEVIKEVVVEKIVEVIKEVPSPPTEIKVIEYIDREVVKEVIKEVFVSNIDNIYDKPEPIIIEKIVEVIKEVEKIIEVEKIVEVIKEVEKDGDDKLKLKMDALQNTLQKIRTENIEKDKLINEYQKTIEDIQKFQENKQAVYLSGSNLNKKM